MEMAKVLEISNLECDVVERVGRTVRVYSSVNSVEIYTLGWLGRVPIKPYSITRSQKITIAELKAYLGIR